MFAHLHGEGFGISSASDNGHALPEKGIAFRGWSQERDGEVPLQSWCSETVSMHPSLHQEMREDWTRHQARHRPDHLPVFAPDTEEQIAPYNRCGDWWHALSLPLFIERTRIYCWDSAECRWKRDVISTPHTIVSKETAMAEKPHSFLGIDMFDIQS